MGSYFYMWEPRREYLIAKHQFLVSEGKSRLTDQFSDPNALEKEADEHAEAWLARRSKNFDPDRDDEGDLYETAYHRGIEFHFALDELGNSARLALISSMFHLWERSLRDWLTSNDGVGSWCMGSALPDAIWKSNFAQIFELFACAGLFIGDNPTKEALDTCRMVVNTYKHGKGDSLEKLKGKRPELFDQYGSSSKFAKHIEYADHTDLYVEAGLIDEFSDAIISFWEEIPEYITDSEMKNVPKWFFSAHEKDRKEASSAT